MAGKIISDHFIAIFEDISLPFSTAFNYETTHDVLDIVYKKMEHGFLIPFLLTSMISFLYKTC